MKSKILIFVFLLFICLNINPVKAENVSVDVGYPVVDEMEQKVLGSAHPQENIYQRLDRLEMKIYGSVTKAPLSDRVDRLRETALGKPVQKYASSQNYQNYPNYQGYSSPNIMFSQTPQSPEEYKIILYELEKKLLGTVYLTEPIDMRVARLENKVFAASSDDYPMVERIQRLCAYADAQESDQYYDDQDQLKQYNQIVVGTKLLSLLFMILQAFL